MLARRKLSGNSGNQFVPASHFSVLLVVLMLFSLASGYLSVGIQPFGRCKQMYSMNHHISDQCYHVHRTFQTRLGATLEQKSSELANSTLALNGQPIPAAARSYIESIRCHNLAGFYNYDLADGDGQDTSMINIELGPNMVAVTGETGAGKSLLVAKLVTLVLGGKATPSMVPSGQAATVEVTLRLAEPYLSWIQRALHESLGPEMPLNLFPTTDSGRTSTALTIQRVLERGDKRLSSTLSLNGFPITLKLVRQLLAPLVVVIDSAAAAASLARPTSRLQALDTAIDAVLLAKVQQAQKDYRRSRYRREELEQELNSRPASITGEVNVEMLQHWVDELNAFQAKIQALCSLISPQSEQSDTVAAFVNAANVLSRSQWSSHKDNNMYDNLLSFQEELRQIDIKISAAASARDALLSLSSASSAISALERARGYLFDVVGNEDEQSSVASAAERAHDCINKVEFALRQAARILEDDPKGLLQTLESMRSRIDVSSEEVDSLVSEWNTLARKHGVSPFSLPSCHSALFNELTGNVEAQTQLPMALEDEKAALELLIKHCDELSRAREVVAASLSKAVTGRLPSLGMAGSTFTARLKPGIVDYEQATVSGVDSLDFVLMHGPASTDRGGLLENVASSGEKARIMLAMECELPGSAGAMCTNSPSEDRQLPPITVLYDEIDAHVGGRAAVSMAHMLATQKGQQVISITHSPSVAAVADTHIVVQKHPSTDSQQAQVPVSVNKLDEDQRRQELARMASGDLAPEEALKLADALLRDTLNHARSA